MIRLDGGLATTLQRVGLPPQTPVDGWLTRRPDAIRAAHAAFAAAGAEIVLAGTFRLLPGVCDDWERLAGLAVRLAHEAVGERAHVWASIGPGSGAADLARRCVDAGAEGVALETFVDPATCPVAEVRRAVTVPVAATLVPRGDGRLWSGGAPSDGMKRLLDAGADAVGFNCAPVDAVRAAVADCAAIDAALWVKPDGTGPEEALVAGLRALSRRCAWVGGCCGVTPELLQRTQI